MNFFQLQNKLFYSKKTNAEFLDSEGEQSFAPFMFNRWLSFYSKGMASITNETLNRFGSVFQDKQQQYRLYYYFIPRLKFKCISYNKKSKKEEVEEDNLDIIARNKNISVRELKSYMDLQNTTSK